MNHSKRTEKGTAVVELALVLPFFMIVLFGIVDLFFLIQKTQHLSMVVRELGSAAYRQCNMIEDSAQARTCLTNSASEVVNFVNNSSTISGTKAIIRLWKVNENEGFAINPTLIGQVRTDNTINSRYLPVNIRSLHSYDKSLRNSVITVEVFLDSNDNITPLFNRNLYETIIF